MELYSVDANGDIFIFASDGTITFKTSVSNAVSATDTAAVFASSCIFSVTDSTSSDGDMLYSLSGTTLTLAPGTAFAKVFTKLPE